MLDKSQKFETPERSNEDRSAIYRLFSSLFARPLTSVAITQIAQVRLGEMRYRDPHLALFFELIQSVNDQPHRAQADLAAAYASLFLGAGGPQSVPPYQSCFANDRGRMCHEPAAKMARWLHDLEMHVQDEFPEPADHIAIIFAVAARLIETDAPAPRQSAFVQHHLDAWLPDFSTACGRCDRFGFYAPLARIAQDFVAQDLCWLQARMTSTLVEGEKDV